MRSNAPILIFGAFNPPTNAHIAMSDYLHINYPNCSIIYVVAKDEYLKSDWKKQDKILDMDTRIRLLNECTEDFVNVSDIERILSGNTYDTIEAYKRLAGFSRFNIALGADNLKNFNQWHNWEQLADENDFIIFTRGENKNLPNYLKKYKNNFTFLKFHWNLVSSTKVREACRKKDWVTVKNLVPINVYQYIKETNTWT